MPTGSVNRCTASILKFILEILKILHKDTVVFYPLKHKTGLNYSDFNSKHIFIVLHPQVKFGLMKSTQTRHLLLKAGDIGGGGR